LWGKGLNAKDNHEETFAVYGEKYLSRKAVHNYFEKRGKRFAHDEDINTEDCKWLKQQ
jgi:hypothetical protein